MALQDDDNQNVDRVAPLAAWLSACLDDDINEEEITISAPGDGGWSNETWIATTGSLTHPRVVVRLQPERASMFPTYDLGRQLAYLDLLARYPDIPTPEVIAADIEGRWFGRPAFIMSHVTGLVPRDDSPTFAEEGWLYDAEPGQQRTFHTSLLDAIAAIHGVEPGDLSQVAEPDSNQAAVIELRELWAFDRGPRWPSVLDDALDALGTDVPEPTSDGLLWGDARPANVITDPATFRPAALLDWELATIGSPERDLTWLMEMNWMRTLGAGVAPLPGFLSDEDSVEHYSQHTGRELENPVWYRHLAAVRVAILMHRYLRGQVHTDRLDAEHRIFSANVASRRVEARLF